MNNIYRYILVIFCGLGISACQHIEEQYAEELVDIRFTATTENHTPTKTTLEGNLGDGTHQVLWSPEDEIAIVPLKADGSLVAYAFKNTSAESSQTAVFEGKATNAEKYYAFYPYSCLGATRSDNMTFTLSGNVTYQEGTFSAGGFPMAAKVDAGADISFNNLCGMLALRLTGTENVRSIAFMANNSQMVAGDFSVDMSDDEWKINPVSSNTSTVVMDCGEEGVTLKEGEATVFYFVLPPQTYETFDIQIVTSEGGMMFKHAGKPLEIKRSVLTPSGALSYVESYAIDLSERGTANSYMIHNAGLYSFDASVIGIGNEGIIPDAGYHTADAAIVPSDAKLVWSEPENIVGNLKYDSATKRISFYTNGTEGNAVIAATDAEGTILWGWHIWMTDMPVEQRYVNGKGEFYVLDRNLGATRADKGNGDQWKESVGVYYQWGRKDPFRNGYYTKENSAISIEKSIVNPAVFSVWSPWMTPENHGLWDSSMKTIYDPCPVGYVINSDSVWESFKNQTVTNIGNGWELAYDGANKTWIPAAAWIDTGGTLITRDYEVYMWSGKHDKNLHINNSSLGIGGWQLNNGFTVRCMKDENYIDPLYASMVIKEIGDVTGSSATITTTITHIGKGDITSRGVVYGTTPTVTVENGTKVESTDNALEFVTQITGMEMATKYYVRAYAINEAGIAYSNPESFHTLYEGEGINLSEDGTANSYIVPPTYAAYTFDCTVKGNSTESVGEAASVEVIWETKNTLDAVSLGEIIPSVELLDGKVKFMLPFEPVHGNALIAVKDAVGTIIWSWHIWVTDYDPETDADLYPSGAKMMDRNLGALNNSSDVASYGFFYQWGRKDPLSNPVDGSSTIATWPVDIKTYVQEVNTLDYMIQHPTEVALSGTWNSDQTLWNTNKTVYDPCPSGWRVPDGAPGVWEGAVTEKGASGGHYINSSPKAFYPGTGYISAGTKEHSYVGSAIYCRTCTSYSESIGYTCVFFIGSMDPYRTVGNLDQHPVRCMKDAAFFPVTLGCSNITEEGATLNGNLTINDNTVIEEMGFVVSKTNSDISVSNENCTKLIVDNTTGEFSTNATGLVTNTTYYFRAFAKGGNNIKYGEVLEFRTHSIGISDDFTGDDYVWE